MKIKDGRRIRQNCLLRTGNLSEATPKDLEILREIYNIHDVIDFRDRRECEEFPDRSVIGSGYHHLPMLAIMNFTNETEQKQFQERLKEDPVGMLKRAYWNLAVHPMAQEAYRCFFQIILRADGRSVLWHCTQGKDRTGAAAILLLAALGVPEQAIKEEYFITNKIMQKEYDRLIKSGLPEDQWDVMKTELFVRKDCVNLFFHVVQKKYGGMDSYLENVLKLQRADRKELRQRYCRE